MFIYALSIFLTSTAFVSTNAKYGIPLSRYTVFLQNCPLGYDPKCQPFFFGGDDGNRTHVRKPLDKTFSVGSLFFRFPDWGREQTHSLAR